MNTIGKIQASLASATQETTLALANANFDFSLIKFEAPAEYRELGVALSKKKRSEAEFGSVHVTAQRLGSLFQSILPATPNLIQAYGQRASEIAQSLATTPQSDEAYGPFRDWIGFDGTSIWAAATSSSAAISCHLLACMLACCWRPEEATAIWLEIVSERKRELEEKVAHAESFSVDDAVSAKLSLDKEQLAAWDNSARAWLAAANDSPVVQSRQKAIRGLLDKVNGTVHSQQDVYTSVTAAWRLALETLEKVVCGMSFGVDEGAVVLALMSWHLYPNIILLKNGTVEVKQKDDLVQSSQITIGLTRPAIGNHTGNNGVHWSLSLGHLRYYGSGRVTSRSLRCTPSGNSRFTFDEFLLIILGACMSQWSQYEEITIQSATDFIILLMSKFEEVLSSVDSSKSQLDGSWIRLILSALTRLKISTQTEQRNAFRFLNLGWRYPNLAKLNKSLSRDQFRGGPFINYPCYHAFGLGTLQFGQVLRKADDQEAFLKDSMKCFMSPRHYRTGPHKKYNIVLLLPKYQDLTEIIFYCRVPFESSKIGKGAYKEIREVRTDGSYIITPRTIRIEPEGTLLWEQPSRPIERLLKKACPLFRKSNEYRSFEFSCVAKFHSHDVYSSQIHDTEWFCDASLPSAKIRDYLCTKQIDQSALLRFLSGSLFFSFLRILSAGSELYAGIPGATISPNILETQNLHTFVSESSRVSSRDHGAILRHNFTQALAFRFLVFLETAHDLGVLKFVGDDLLNSSGWNDVLAVSTEDTLYMDPIIIGNPPADRSHMYGWFSGLDLLDLKKPDPKSWQLINHYPFDGKLEDCFSSTSLHLRFSGYSQVLDFGAHNRISNGARVEAVVSAFDQGEWLGDVDILRALRTPSYLRIVDRKPDCLHSTVDHLPQRELVTIENWEELLSPHPSVPGVVKCHGNWQARLTAVSLCVRLCYRTLLFDRHGCWDCAFKTLDAWDLISRRSSSASSSTDSDNNDESPSGDDEISNSDYSSSESDEPKFLSRAMPRTVVFIL
ncbi:hypothetical protein F5Y19DRAFT_463390 [Xylariaceae sp. FL1651]|nr:hypothetical protein F5Y19DRAFT_463390 [Xylariaceae sp. FL1651]